MKGKGTFKWGEVILISTSHLLHDIYSSFLVPLLPLLKDKLSINNSTIGLLTIIQRSPTLLNPFIGILADKFPLRYFIILAPAITSVSMSLIGLAPNIAILIILLFVMGISSTMFHTPSPVMVKEVSGDFPGRGMSFYMIGGEFARTLAPLIITGAVTIWGLEGTWKLMPFGLIASALLYLKFRKIPISNKIKPDNGYSGVIQILQKLFPFYVTLSLFIFFRGIAKSSLTVFITIYLVEKGSSMWLANGALAIFQFAGVAGVIFSGIVSDKIGSSRTLVIISIITPLLMLFFIMSSGLYMMLALILLGLIILSTGPVLLSLVNQLNSEHASLLNGLFMTVSFGVGALATMIAGFTGDMFGLEMTFKIAAIFSIGSLPFALLLSKWEKPKN